MRSSGTSKRSLLSDSFNFLKVVCLSAGLQVLVGEPLILTSYHIFSRSHLRKLLFILSIRLLLIQCQPQHWLASYSNHSIYKHTKTFSFLEQDRIDKNLELVKFKRNIRALIMCRNYLQLQENY